MQLRNTEPDRLLHGLKRLSDKQYKAVHTDSIAMIERRRDDDVPYFLLGIIAFEHKNYQKAVELFKQACALNLGSSRYRAHYAQVLTTLGQQVPARQVANEAASLPISDAYIADTLGVVLSRTGFHEDAAPFFQKAVEIDPRPANYHYNLASSLQFMGAFDDARVSYLEALDREPKLYRAWSSLVMLSKQTDEDNHLTTLQSLFDAPDANEDARLHLGHAIAKTLEDLNRYEESLSWLKRAKEKKRDTIGYSATVDRKHFAAAKQTLLSPESNAPGGVDASPIFIVGLPRTGTTLVDRILSSHSDVRSGGELNTFAGLIKAAAGTPSNLVMDEDTLASARSLDLTEIGRRYISDTAALAKGATRMTDKMPLNFFYAGLIHQALPNARIIALRRGAMDSCLSNYRQLFSTTFSYYNYTFSLEDTARFYRGFDDLMGHWSRVIPADRFTEIAYEDIVFDQENQTRRLLEFCGLSWQDACLRFHENAAPVSTASSVQVRQPLYSGSIGRWKKYGTSLDTLKRELGELAV